MKQKKQSGTRSCTEQGEQIMSEETNTFSSSGAVVFCAEVQYFGRCVKVARAMRQAPFFSKIFY
jgi:hypothetical protein